MDILRICERGYSNGNQDVHRRIQVSPRVSREVGSDPESKAREVEPSAPTIRVWVEAAKEARMGGQVLDKDARIRELERKLRVAEESVKS